MISQSDCRAKVKRVNVRWGQAVLELSGTGKRLVEGITVTFACYVVTERTRRLGNHSTSLEVFNYVRTPNL
jgi:hypothetical protein